ncbi:hypothetical protein EVAR_102763_1 [Eumeta japonica]|uniref:RNA-directed DNA polymerase from mobile element jockey n=1 Tax=Eumeta variegata TaxID=151549 RepID=A0A4C1TIR2_EUMVA|nr:hypothetical protein EVAR_102763_1 [Eumeta japonica]
MQVRDPINKSIAKQTREINGVLITPVDTIKYLGTYLTSELSQRNMIKARCKQAIRNTKGLIVFIKKTKMHWKIAKLIYKMVISPSMTYGLNVVALTKSNRTRLRQYEREILKDMLQAARNQPKLKTQEILEGKTITKINKCMPIDRWRASAGRTQASAPKYVCAADFPYAFRLISEPFGPGGDRMA